MPRAMSQRQVNDYLAETMTLDRQIAAFEAVVAAQAALGSAAADERWRDFLTASRRRDDRREWDRS